MQSLTLRHAALSLIFVLGISSAVVWANADSQAALSATPIALELPTKPPKNAQRLLSGTPESLKENWLKRYTKEDANGSVGKDGVWTPNHSDITSKQEFGDCFLHVEFRCPIKGAGNAGVALQGRYEVQIFNTYEQPLDTHNGGALYDQKPAKVNASKKPGEWQTYDIVFRAPRFDAKGTVTEKPRVTLFWNGILTHSNEEFLGMTGIQYGEFKNITPTGPIILQGDHEIVQYRNVWIVPM
jgi:hypothetical protein